MNEALQNGSYDEDLTIFFEDKLVGEADLVFQLAYAFTLDRKIAFEVVQKVYKELIKNLSTLAQKDSQEVRLYLLQVGYEFVRDMKEAKSNDTSVVASFLRSFGPKERVTLMMVEIAGIYPNECSKILSLEEKDIRNSLAKVRESLIKFSRKE